MKMLIKDININYEVSGVGPPLFFLHGWGSDLHTFDKLSREINEDFTVYQIDLPGFGKSEISGEYSLDEYADIINEFCLSLAINSPIILGHSFGGRVGIVYASKYKVKKLILVCSPGVKQKFNILKWFKVKIYKLMKFLKLNINTGSNDYKNAKGYLKNILVKAVNRDLSMELSKIDTPTLLIYGGKDKTVKPYIGKEINKKIKNSGLVIVPNCGHFPYIERFRYFLIVLKAFIIGDSI